MSTPQDVMEHVASTTRLAFADAGLDNVEVTFDSARAGSHLAAGVLVAVVTPPRIEFPTWHHSDMTCDVWLICGPRAAPMDALPRLSEAIDALCMPLALTEAKPETFTDAQNGAYAAYVVTTDITPTD